MANAEFIQKDKNILKNLQNCKKNIRIIITTIIYNYNILIKCKIIIIFAIIVYTFCLFFTVLLC